MNELTIQELSNSDLIRSRIFTIRGVQVMLDRDLAELYGVATKALNQAVKRNIERFPERYMFQLNKDDVANMRSQIVTGSSTETSLRSQIVTLNKGQGQHLKYMPYAFEQMKKFVRMAKKELIIIDPYFADSVLPLIAQKRKDVEVLVVKNSRSKLLHDVDVAQFNAQYANSPAA